MNQPGSEMITGKEYETYELLYKEAGTMFRHFLNWRRLLFAGYLAVLSALALAFKWTLAHAASLSFVCPAAGVVISLVFWGFDYRNRVLFRYAAEVGKRLEKKLGLPDIGYYDAFDKGRKRKKSRKRNKGQDRITHSFILNMFFFICTIVMLVLTYLLFCEVTIGGDC